VIPRANINAWRKVAPWPDSAQVEQDLVISRALVEMYSRSEVAQGLVFRGGTALHKLYLHPAGRYSEDIDLVQRDAFGRPVKGGGGVPDRQLEAHLLR